MELVDKRLPKVTALKIRDIMLERELTAGHDVWISKYELNEFFDDTLKNTSFLGPTIQRMYDRGELVRVSDINTHTAVKRKIFYYRLNDEWVPPRVTAGREAI